jgi:hypothetical protein
MTIQIEHIECNTPQGLTDIENFDYSILDELIEDDDYLNVYFHGKPYCTKIVDEDVFNTTIAKLEAIQNAQGYYQQQEQVRA